MKVRALIALGFIAGFAAACASTGTSPNDQSARIFTGHGDVHALASCFVEEMNKAAGSDYQYIRMSETDGVHVTGQAVGASSDDATFDVLFKPSSKDAVTAMLKTRASGWGGGPDYPDYVVTSLSKCGITG